jgi:hypothetical protein
LSFFGHIARRNNGLRYERVRFSRQPVPVTGKGCVVSAVDPRHRRRPRRPLIDVVVAQL